MEIQSVVRGDHIYKVVWTPVIGEELSVLSEENNDHDRSAWSAIVSHTYVYTWWAWCTRILYQPAVAIVRVLFEGGY